MTDGKSSGIAPEILLERAATALADAAAGPEPLDEALTALAVEFRGEARFARPHVNGVADPERSLLSAAHEGSPVGIDSEFLPRTTCDAVDEVTMTGLQVALIADLLRELAARLRPGAAFGLSTAGLALAEHTDHLADTLTDLTPVRRPAPRAVDPAEHAAWLTHAMSVRRADLRNAVVRVLDLVGAARTEQPTNPVALSDVLESSAGEAAMAALARATHYPTEQDVVSPVDPGFFLRSVPGRSLVDEAEAMRELLAAESVSPTEPPLVTLGPDIASTAGLLLRELDSRLLPGITYGLLPVRSDLGIVAGDLAAELLAQTPFGRPTFYPGPTRMWITASDRLPSAGTAPDLIDPVDHLTPAVELLVPTVDPSTGETFDEYKRIRAAALDLSRLLDDRAATDDHFAHATRQLHSAIHGGVEAPAADSRQPLSAVVHQQWRSVELSPREVVIAADLLDELAARTQPGAAFGPSDVLVESSTEYTEMAARLRDLSSSRRSSVAASAPNSRTRLGRLRDAAVHWLDIVADGRDGWRDLGDPAWRDATLNLYLLAHERPPRTPTPPVRDPARHLRRHSAAEVVELAAEAADIAKLLPIGGLGEETILVPADLAPYVGTALGELATRLTNATGRRSPGAEQLAAIASRLGRRILDHALVSYHRRWEWEAELPGPRGQLDESEARARDRAGESYSVVLGEPHRPDTIIDVRAGELQVTKVDEDGRPRLRYEFRRENSTMLFLASVTLYRYEDKGRGGVTVERFGFEPNGTATRITGQADQSTWEESVAEVADAKRLRQPVPQFGDWEQLRDLNPLTRPRESRPQVHYSLAWDSARGAPRALIPADQARRLHAQGRQYCVILGPQDDPRVLVTVCRNDNAFAVHLFDDVKRVRAIHTFQWIDDRFLHRAQQRLIYADSRSRAHTLLATFEVRPDGLARAIVAEPHGRGIISERIESADVAQFWFPLPEFGAWGWTSELSSSPEHWVEQDLVP